MKIVVTFAFRNNLYMNIKKILSEKGVSYQELADIINASRPDGARRVTTASISQMVNGEPSVKSMREIANAIGCKVGDFFIDEVSPTGTMTVLVRHGSNYYSAETTDELRRIADEIDGKSADR